MIIILDVEVLRPLTDALSTLYQDDPCCQYRSIDLAIELLDYYLQHDEQWWECIPVTSEGDLSGISSGLDEVVESLSQFLFDNGYDMFELFHHQYHSLILIRNT